MSTDAAVRTAREGLGSELDLVNRATWSAEFRDFIEQDSWTDPGERNALFSIADQVRGKRILDIGVGPGRTYWTVGLLSPDYTAIDYTPEMVRAFGALHPGVDVREADARALNCFDDESFDLVVFSCNGLDALSHDDRQLALAEVRRVLRTDGIFFFSSLNHDGPLYTETPKDLVRLRQHSARAVIGYLLDSPRRRRRLRSLSERWSALKNAAEDHGSWGIAPLSAHEFGLLTHYISPAQEVAELAAAGFDVVTMFDRDGQEFSPETAPPTPHFHVIARAR